MKLAFYGKLGEVIGREITLEQGDYPDNVGALRSFLSAQYPELAGELSSERAKIIVDDIVVGDEFSLLGVELAEFLPPVSGG